MKLLFVSNVPSFYKILFFKELAKSASVQVYFTNRSKIKRNKNFYWDTERKSAINGNFSLIFSIKILISKVMTSDYIYYGGWDDILYWMLIFFTPKRKNCLILESSVYEYNPIGVKNNLLKYAKMLFLKRISLVIASGVPQGALLERLLYKNKIQYSNSVGILDFDYKPILKERSTNVKTFLFIGRISYTKGVDILYRVFSTRPDLQLYLVGEREDYTIFQQQYPNIKYLGYKSRDELKDIFDVSDVFILPSRVEPWGLVIEEALYHGLPVIVSSKVGCGTDLVEKYGTGLVFDVNSQEELELKIELMLNEENYNFYLMNISKIDFEARRSLYIQSFLNE